MKVEFSDKDIKAFFDKGKNNGEYTIIKTFSDDDVILFLQNRITKNHIIQMFTGNPEMATFTKDIASLLQTQAYMQERDFQNGTYNTDYDIIDRAGKYFELNEIMGA